VIWLALRQQRNQLLAAAALVVAVGVVLLATGPHILHLYDTTVAGCAAHGDCQSAINNFKQKTNWAVVPEDLVMVVPALLGIFWGAPLVARELETGTFRLAWTQSVTRSRWLWVRLAVVTVSAMVVAGAITAMVAWWSSPIDRLRETPFGYFDRHGVVPVAYAAFAVVLGVALGAVIRRTLPAMAAVLGVFVAARLFVSSWVRPRLWPPLQVTTTYLGPTPNAPPTSMAAVAGQRSAWIVSTTIYDRAGRVVGHSGGIGSNGLFEFSQVSTSRAADLVGLGRCPNRFPIPTRGNPTAFNRAVRECVGSFHLHAVTAYQPASRYWPFQGLESAVFVVAALLLAGFTWWWVRRRLV
jgi:hypothetical protein